MNSLRILFALLTAFAGTSIGFGQNSGAVADGGTNLPYSGGPFSGPLPPPPNTSQGGGTSSGGGGGDACGAWGHSLIYDCDYQNYVIPFGSGSNWQAVPVVQTTFGGRDGCTILNEGNPCSNVSVRLISGFVEARLLPVSLLTGMHFALALESQILSKPYIGAGVYSFVFDSSLFYTTEELRARSFYSERDLGVWFSVEIAPQNPAHLEKWGGQLESESTRLSIVPKNGSSLDDDIVSVRAGDAVDLDFRFNFFSSSIFVPEDVVEVYDDGSIPEDGIFEFFVDYGVSADFWIIPLKNMGEEFNSNLSTGEPLSPGNFTVNNGLLEINRVETDTNRQYRYEGKAVNEFVFDTPGYFMIYARAKASQGAFDVATYKVSWIQNMLDNEFHILWNPAARPYTAWDTLRQVTAYSLVEVQFAGGGTPLGGGALPELVDTDGDGLPDWWERDAFGSETLYSGSDNPDDDQRDNLSEYLSGTNPLLFDGDFTNGDPLVGKKRLWVNSQFGRVHFDKSWNEDFYFFTGQEVGFRIDPRMLRLLDDSMDFRGTFLEDRDLSVLDIDENDRVYLSELQLDGRALPGREYDDSDVDEAWLQEEIEIRVVADEHRTYNALWVFEGDDTDGLPWDWELAYRLDPKDGGDGDIRNGPLGDPDGDGLTNLEEFQFNSNPLSADGDDDGIPDFWEVTNGTDPLLDDTSFLSFHRSGLDNELTYVDRDGLDTDEDGGTNLIEDFHGLLASDEDSDDDGITDGWELYNGLGTRAESSTAGDRLYTLVFDQISPLDSVDASADLDFDGLSNLREFQLGLNPRDADTDRDGLGDGWEDAAGNAAPSDFEGLSAWWLFDRDTNGLVLDRSGNHLDMVLHGEAHLGHVSIARKMNLGLSRALSLSGNDAYAMALPKEGAVLAESFGLAFFLGLNDLPSDTSRLLVSQRGVFELMLDSDAELKLVVTTDAEDVELSVPFDWQGAERNQLSWTHLGVSFDDATKDLQVYEAGELKAAFDLSGLTVATSQWPLMLGSPRAEVNRTPEAWISDFRLYSRTLTADLMERLAEPDGDYGDRVQDPDGDGLLNWQEYLEGTDPIEADTDGDELTDYEEVEGVTVTAPAQQTYNPQVPGVSVDCSDDTYSRTYTSNPLRADSDGDGIEDFDEVNLFRTNPKRRDTDGDNLSDYREIFVESTCALLRDSDGDGAPDDAELNHGFDPLDPTDGFADADGDGISNADELLGYSSEGERVGKSNPRVANDTDFSLDSDDDGLTDFMETQYYGTRIDSDDTIGDGLGDAFRVKYRLIEFTGALYLFQNQVVQALAPTSGRELASTLPLWSMAAIFNTGGLCQYTNFPDQWGAEGDADLDGVSNSGEKENGTSPTDPCNNSVKLVSAVPIREKPEESEPEPRSFGDTFGELKVFVPSCAMEAYLVSEADDLEKGIFVTDELVITGIANASGETTTASISVRANAAKKEMESSVGMQVDEVLCGSKVIDLTGFINSLYRDPETGFVTITEVKRQFLPLKLVEESEEVPGADATGDSSGDSSGGGWGGGWGGGGGGGSWGWGLGVSTSPAGRGDPEPSEEPLCPYGASSDYYYSSDIFLVAVNTAEPVEVYWDNSEDLRTELPALGEGSPPQAEHRETVLAYILPEGRPVEYAIIDWQPAGDGSTGAPADEGKPTIVANTGEITAGSAMGSFKVIAYDMVAGPSLTCLVSPIQFKISCTGGCADGQCHSDLGEGSASTSGGSASSSGSSGGSASIFGGSMRSMLSMISSGSSGSMGSMLSMVSIGSIGVPSATSISSVTQPLSSSSLKLGLADGAGGTLAFRISSLTDGSISLENLSYDRVNHSGVEVLYDSSGAIRQIVGDNFMFDVTSDQNDQIVVDVYDTTGLQLSSSNDLYDAPEVSVGDERRAVIERPDAGSEPSRGRYTVSHGSDIEIWEFGYQPAGAVGTSGVAWTLGTGYQPTLDRAKSWETLSETVELNGDQLERRTVENSDGVILSDELSTYRDFDFGRRLVESQDDPDGAGKQTEYGYYTKTGGSGAYGRLMYRIDPDGSWVRYGYDNQGRISHRASPFMGSGVDDFTMPGEVVEYIYAPHGTKDDGSLYPDVPRTEVTRVLGLEVSRRYRIFEPGKRIEIKTVRPGASPWSEANQRTETWYETEGEFSGHVSRVLQSNGTVVLHDYERTQGGEFDGELVTTTLNGVPSPDGQSVTAGSQTITRKRADGEVRVRESYDVASGLITDYREVVAFDEEGREVDVLYLDGSMTHSVYACCGLESFTDRDGSVTAYTYEDGRLHTKTQAGVEQVYGYDALGRQTSTTINTTEQTLVQSETKYAATGRVEEVRDALGRPTLYGEPYAGLGYWLTTTTLPDLSTQTTSYFLDGSVQRIYGTAVASSEYTYGVEFDASLGIYARTQTVVRLAEDGAATEWVKTFTDMEGRTYRTVYPDGAEESRRSDVEQRIDVAVDADGVMTVTEYDALGRIFRQGVDVDGSGGLEPLGPDRITESRHRVEEVDGVTWHTTERWIYADALSDQAVRASVSMRSVDGLRTRRIDIHGNTAESSVVREGAGQRHTIDVAADGSSVERWFDDGRPVAETTYDAAGDALQASTYAYDAFGRLGAKTDSRTGTTFYDYYDDGRIREIIAPDPDGDVLDDQGTVVQHANGDGSHDPLVTLIAYDSMGRETLRTLPDASSVHSVYNTRGLLAKTYGALQSPVEYTYDYAGRQQTMTTWQDFDEATGVGLSGSAITTWIYDSQRGWLDRKEYDDGNGTDYTYTAGGRLASRTWARGVTTNYAYSTAGELLAVDYDDAGVTPDVHYTYTRTGQQDVVSDGQYAAAAFTAGQILTPSLPLDSVERSSTYGYNARFQVDTETTSGLLAADSVLTRTYEDGTETNGLLGRTRGYSFTGGQSSVIATTHAYDAAGRLKTVTDGTDTFTYGYTPNAGNLLASMTSPVHTATYSYESGRNAMTGIENKETVGTASVVSNYAYTYNALGQRADREQSGTAFGSTNTDTFSYDYLGQVTASANDTLTGNSYNPSYAFDEIGNRTGATVDLNGSTSYTQDLLNQYTAVGSNTPVYDADGNLTSNGTWTYAWNGESRLINATNGSATIDFVYDYQGRLVEKDDGTNIEVYVYDGWNRIAKYVDGSHSETYLWGLDLSGSSQGAGGVGGLLKETTHQSPVTTLYSLFDANGNIVQKLNASGVATMSVEYDPFGNIINGTLVGEYGFSTKPLIESVQWYYYGFRYYDSVTGRWLSKDPIEETGGLNVYGFVGNDSVNDADYLGNIKIELRFNPVGGGQEFLGQVRYHAYVIITKCESDSNQLSGQKTLYIRGGPSQSNGNGGVGDLVSPGGNFGDIIMEYGDYYAGTVDYAVGASSVTVFEDWSLSDMEETKIVLDAYTIANNIGRAGIRYAPLGPNSNTAAYQVLDDLGYGRPGPPVSAPGWQIDIFSENRRSNDRGPETPRPR